MMSPAGYLRWGLIWGGGLILLFVSQRHVFVRSSFVPTKQCEMVVEYGEAPQLLLAIPSQSS